MGLRQRSSPGTASRAAPRAHLGQKTRSIRGFSFRPCAGDEDPAPVMTPTDKDLRARRRRDTVAVREFLHLRLREPGSDIAEHITTERITRPIDSLEVTKQQHQFLDVRNREPVLIAMQRMRNRVCQIALHEESAQLVKMLLPLQKLPVVRLREPPHQHMDASPILRELRGDFRAEENTRTIRNRQTAIERIAVREREAAHPTSPRLFIKVERFRIAVRQPQPTKQPLRSRARVLRM